MIETERSEVILLNVMKQNHEMPVERQHRDIQLLIIIWAFSVYFYQR